MTTQARLGYGVKLRLGDGATPTETFAEIAEIKTLDDGDSAEAVEVTNHQSPGRRKQFIPGLIDGDEISLTLNYIPGHATHSLAAGLRGLVGVQRNFRLEEPGNSTGVQVSCVITNVGRSYPVENAMEMSVTLKKTGALSTYVVS